MRKPKFRLQDFLKTQPPFREWPVIYTPIHQSNAAAGLFNLPNHTPIRLLIRFCVLLIPFLFVLLIN